MIINFFTRNVIFHEPFYEHLQGSTERHLVEQWDHWAPSVVYQQTIWENCAPFVLNQFLFARLPGVDSSTQIYIS